MPIMISILCSIGSLSDEATGFLDMHAIAYALNLHAKSKLVSLAWEDQSTFICTFKESTFYSNMALDLMVSWSVCSTQVDG